MTPGERAEKMIQYQIENDSLQFDYKAFYAAEIRQAEQDAYAHGHLAGVHTAMPGIIKEAKAEAYEDAAKIAERLCTIENNAHANSDYWNACKDIIREIRARAKEIK
jgi:hypothetical protein